MDPKYGRSRTSHIIQNEDASTILLYFKSATFLILKLTTDCEFSVCLLHYQISQSTAPKPSTATTPSAKFSRQKSSSPSARPAHDTGCSSYLTRCTNVSTTPQRSLAWHTLDHQHPMPSSTTRSPLAPSAKPSMLPAGGWDTSSVPSILSNTCTTHTLCSATLPPDRLKRPQR